jgi:hypothetical protein
MSDVISRHWLRLNRMAAVLLLFVDQVSWKSLAVALEGVQVATAASELLTDRRWGEYEGGLVWSRGRTQERRYPETCTRIGGDAFGRPVLQHRSMIWLMDFCERS